MKTRRWTAVAVLLQVAVVGTWAMGAVTDGVNATVAATQSESVTLTGTSSGEATSELLAQSASARPTVSRDRVETLIPVTFDASEIEVQSPSSALFSWDLTGNGVPDVTSTVPMLRYTFEKAGTYSVRVRVTDDAGTDTLSDAVEVVVVNRAPQASFLIAPGPKTDLTTTEFEDSSVDLDGSIVAWSWNFGDGASSIESNPLHNYSTAGEYEVSLTVLDDSGAWSELYTKVVRIGNTPPVASFDAPSTAHVGDVIAFADHSIDPSLSGSIVHVAWDFGDGSYTAGASAGKTYAHTYSAPGDYVVTLYVIDDSGGLGTRQATVRVTEAS
jgi:PKD repeat protein